MCADLFTDGGARGNPGPAGIGVVLRSKSGKEAVISKYIGRATNNQAEYQALLAGLKLALEHEVQNLRVHMDSELIVRQMQGIYKVRNRGLRDLYDSASRLRDQFGDIHFVHVPREENKLADELVNQAIDKVK